MKKIITLASLFAAVTFHSQEKKVHLTNAENLLLKIIPEGKISSWTVIYHLEGKERTLQSENRLPFESQGKGFKLNPHGTGYYYIAYLKDGVMKYITDDSSLKAFIGRIDNGEEAALSALAHGYQIDFEFKDYAANYQDKGSYLIVDAGKETSSECPLARTHYTMHVDKMTGAVSAEKDLGPYFELYGKECTNNPHYSALDKQMEEARLRAEEQKRIQKEMTKKMEKKVRKQQRRN